MFVGIGVGIGRNRFAQGIFNAYNARVVADGGITEAGNCVNAVTGLLLNASLLIIPSGYKGGKLYAEIPTNGNGDLTWTRGSDAFRTNASGVLQRVPWNLLQRSEEFDNAYWYKINSSITANTITAPNGTLTADSWIENNTNNFHVFGKSSLSLNSGSYVITIYAKAKERSKFLILYTGTPNKGYGFDLANGTTSAVTGITSADSFSITNVGDGWYRCQIGVASNSIGTIEFTMLTSFSTLSYLGDGTSGLYIWGAQLVEGTTAQTYLPTTDRLNFPRLSYMYGSCPALLLEPQRTNLALYSEQFNDAYWGKSGSTISANTATAPDGNTTGDSLIENSATGFHLISRGTFASGTNTLSVYAKADTRSFAYVALYNGVADFGAYFNLSSGTVGNIDSGVTASIQAAANGWYRCIITFTSAVAVTISIGVASANGTRSYTGNGTSGIFIYGAQIEAGAYATTIIPTTSATATRVADSFSRNNIYTNGLISASGGTWFVELRNNISYTRDNSNRWGICDTTNFSDNGIGFRASSSGRYSLIKCISTAVTTLYTTTAETCKIAIKWNGTTADIFENGVKVVSATAFTTTLMEFIAMNSSFGSGIPTFIQQMALYPTPLSDTDCTTLTTL